MRHFKLLCINWFLGLLCFPLIALTKIDNQLISGNASVTVIRYSENQFGLSFSFNGIEIPTLDPSNPVSLEVKGKKFSGKYFSCEHINDSLLCRASLITSRGSEILVTDKYFA